VKTAVKRAIRDEKGAGVLALVLVLLVVGGLILAPLLGLMSTGLMAGQVYEKKTDELYAADAGVEDAVSRMPGLNLSVGQSTSFTIPDVNGKNVAVNTTCVSNTTQTSGCNATWTVIHKVVSTATGDGSGTKVTAYVKGTSVSQNYSGLLDHVLTSLASGGISIPNNPNVVIDPSSGANGPLAGYGGSWPPAQDLSSFYLRDVSNVTPYSGATTIDTRGGSSPPGPIYINGQAVSCPSGVGPVRVNGGLIIENTVNGNSTLNLTGTLYIEGNTVITTSGSSSPLNVNLNGNTIFVASDSRKGPSSPYALYIGGECAINGPGVIIAVGDIYFQPNMVAGTTGPIFILSVSGSTVLKPSGSFYGAVAGNVLVDVQPGQTVINYPTGGFGDLNFPTGVQYPNPTYSITSWEINPA